jgi:hypothetical protein
MLIILILTPLKICPNIFYLSTSEFVKRLIPRNAEQQMILCNSVLLEKASKRLSCARVLMLDVLFCWSSTMLFRCAQPEIIFFVEM